MKAFVSWSGGKDTCLAMHRAAKDPSIEIAYLLNMVSEDGLRSRTHGVTSEVLRNQAQAMGIPIMQRKASWNNYEEEYKKSIYELKKEGIEAGIFGDIDLQIHRDWVERICSETGIKAMLPLWLEKRESLIKDFFGSGFKSVISAVNKKFVGPEWIGRDFDKVFIDHIRSLGNVDLCGEGGEFHTLVVSGPIFKKGFNPCLKSAL